MSIYLEAVSRFLLTGHAAKEPPTGKSLKIVVFEVWPTRKALAESSGQIVISHRRSFLEPRYDCFGLFVVCFWFEVMFFTDSYMKMIYCATTLRNRGLFVLLASANGMGLVRIFTNKTIVCLGKQTPGKSSTEFRSSQEDPRARARWAVTINRTYQSFTPNLQNA